MLKVGVANIVHIRACKVDATDAECPYEKTGDRRALVGHRVLAGEGNAQVRYEGVYVSTATLHCLLF